MEKFSFVKHCPGHTNSKGEKAPWCILSEKDNKIISSHKTKEEAKNHLQDIEIHKNSFVLIDEINLNSNLYLYKFADVIEGGKGDNLDIKVIPHDELTKGMQIESEHSPDKEIQKDILRDHEYEAISLTGHPNYYKYLEKMEELMKQDGLRSKNE